MQLRRIGLIAAAVTALATVAVASGGRASASTTTKPYTVNISPGPTPQGAPVTFAVVIYNATSPQSIGSANMSIQNTTGFVITGATIASGGSPTATASLSGQTVQLRSLNLLSYTSMTVDITGFAPCAVESNSWTIEAKQSNDFSGPPGNDFYLDTTKSSLTFNTTATRCSLTFAPPNGAQPADSTVNTAISSQPFLTPSPSVPPVEVGVLDANGTLITDPNAPGSSAQVSVALSPGYPTGAVLSGTLTATALSGVAKFSNLSINLPSLSSYALTATSLIATSTTSTPFYIWQSEQTCTGGGNSCGVNLPTSNKGEGTSISAPTTSTGVLKGSLNVQNLTSVCGYSGFFSPFGTTVISGSDISGTGFGVLTAIVTIVKSDVLGPASQYQICYEDPNQFPGGTQTTDSNNNVIYVALLQTCKLTNNVAPCINSITKDKAGDVVESLMVLPGDPYFR